ncbi:hypothetical protein O181_007988 [Austropuccinia psidii MF-1]|uniref:Uncharacterized protein n=1 Tax=Austropuccinia psidii MF-1 TaxID=1389203 RepID=A0A9Q3BN98_9BASI|nr:hypothetical protein [Austropuccinia psidii MF-1]
MEATIQSNQMDVETEEATPSPEVTSIPQERHIFRMPEFPPIPQDLHPQTLIGSNRDLSILIQEFVQRSQRGGVGNMFKPLAGGHELLLTNQELSGSLLSIDQKELEITQTLEKEGPVLSTSSKTAPEVSKDKPNRPQKKQKGPKDHQLKVKGKANWHRLYPQGYRIAQLEPSAVDSIFNMARTLMEFTAKEQERMNRTFPRK